MRPAGLRTVVTAVAAAAVAASLLGAQPAAADHVPRANDDPGFLQVYDANVENLPRVGDTCPGDWQDLVYYLRTQELMPDLFIVQQLSGAGGRHGQLGFLTRRLSEDFGQSYAGLVADADPASGPQRCAPEKEFQTTGIIYRTARFEAVRDGANTWQAQAETGGRCQNNDQARTTAVKVQLRDRISGKLVTVASVHWPTRASGGPPCADANARAVATEMTEEGYGGDLLVFGGDLNVTDAATSGGEDFRSWYRALNGDLGGQHGYRDAIYATCESAGDPGGCRARNWTVSGDRRIDFLFASTGAGAMPAVSAAHTPTFNEGDQADLHFTDTDRQDHGYSDHRAVQARVHYAP